MSYIYGKKYFYFFFKKNFFIQNIVLPLSCSNKQRQFCHITKNLNIMKVFVFLSSFIFPLLCFVNGSLFIGYLIYLTFINPLSTNIVGCSVLSFTFGYCFVLFISDYKEIKKQEILENHYL